MSWKPEVIADGSGKWCGNALRFATKEEAEANVLNLMGRWLLVRETRVTESDDPVNYKWTDHGLESVKYKFCPQCGGNKISGHDSTCKYGGGLYFDFTAE